MTKRMAGGLGRRNPLRTSAVGPETFLRYLRDRGVEFPHRSPNGAILTFDRRLLPYIGRQHGRRFRLGNDLITLPTRPRSVGVLGGFGCGAPITAILLEELFAMGTRRFILVGTAGGLQHTLRIGSIVLCTGAIRDEGTSARYWSRSSVVRPTRTLMSELSDRLEARGLQPVRGTTWTVDACYQLPRPLIAKYRQAGVQTVEMEAAAAFAVARKLGAEAAAVFTVSDLILPSNWQIGFDKVTGDLQTLFDTSVDVLSR